MDDVTRTRRTRFVCVSDTHNASPNDGSWKLPAGDVLIHAGDLTKQGTLAELRKTIAWIAAADFEVKIVVAGNHDITLDKDFYAEQGRNFHNQNLQDPEECIQLLQNEPSIVYLQHEANDIQLTRPAGPQTRFKVFGSPFSPAGGNWAFQYPISSPSPSSSVEAGTLWSAIPLDADITVTHTPPLYHCDTDDRSGEARGCEALRHALWRTRPLLAVSGHVHAARGAELVRWDLSAPNVRYKEEDTGYWEDANRDMRKAGYVSLTKTGGEPLRNVSGKLLQALAGTKEREGISPSPSTTSQPGPGLRSAFRFGAKPGIATVASASATAPSSQAGPDEGTRGLGGESLSQRADTEALEGRLKRKETCIVNAAVMASSWPYPKNPARRFNQPIIVDLDLPCAAPQNNSNRGSGLS